MGTYTEEYHYDHVGNFLQFIHRGSQQIRPLGANVDDDQDCRREISIQPGAKSPNHLDRPPGSANRNNFPVAQCDDSVGLGDE